MRRRFESLWAIRPEAVPTVARLVARDMNGLSPMGGDSARVQTASAMWEAAKPSMRGSGPGKVAVVPIQGVLTNDGPGYYGSNYQTISDAVDRAANDPEVSRIVLAVDSPGGEVTGLPETAAVIAAAAKVKPVSAIVDGAAASAAYWLASQAGDITLTPSGEVGSVGVRMMHIDVSQMLEKEGYAVTEMSSGDYKTEWSPYKPLSEDAQAAMQIRLDKSHGDFLAAVTAGRGTRASKAMVANRYGEGRMHQSVEALAGGLVDKVQPSREFYANLPRSSGNALTGRARARLELAKLRA